MSSPIYAIGDIHGQLAFLEQALAWIEADGGPDAEIVFLGDLVDRGAESRAVIERLIAGQAAGARSALTAADHRTRVRYQASGGARLVGDDQLEERAC